MKTISLMRKMLIVALLGLTTIVNAQNKIYLGIRVPQMNTDERGNIGAETNPLNARGQLIFNTDTGKLQYWDGTKWVQTDETDVNVTSQDGTVGVTRDGSNFDLSVNVKTIADSLSQYIANTILGDSILSYITQNIDNPTFNLGDVIQEYIANNFSTELGNTILNYITNNFPTELGDEILNYITNNFPTALGDEVLNYITENVTQELSKNIMANVIIGSTDNTVIVSGSGTLNIDLSVNIDAIADELTSNNTFITNMGDELVTNNTFVENIINTLYDDTHLKKLIDSIANLIKDGGDVNNFIQEIINQITNETNITQLGDSLAYYFSQTNFGDTILNYITNHISTDVYVTSPNNTITVEGSGTANIKLDVNIDAIADKLTSNETFITNLGDEITNVLYDDTHLKQLIDSLANLIKNGGDVSDLIQQIVNQITQEQYITQIGDNLAYYFSETKLGDTILNYITNNFPAEIGDIVLQYIVNNNITQVLTDSIMSNVNIGSADNTVTVTGSGTSNIDLSVNIDAIADELVSNETFVTNLGDEIINVLYDDTHLKQLIDSLAALINKGGDVSDLIQQIVNQITQEQYITQFGDNLALYFSETKLGDTILNYITNNLPTEIGEAILEYITNNVTQKLTDSIMSKVEVTGKYGIEIEGSGTSNITVKLPEGEKEGQVLSWDNTASVWKAADQTPSVKQVTIPVQNGTFDTKNLIFHGITSTATSALKVVAIEPVFSNLAMRRNFLNVEATVQVVGNAADWTVSIENRNISSANKCTLESVVISYICDDATALTNNTQDITEISGY